MKKNYLTIKDKNIRFRSNYKECLKIIFKTICMNRNLNKNIRFFYFLKLYSGNKSISFNRSINRCIITNRSHSVLRLFKLSRICLKENISLNFIQGLRKSSW